MFSSVNCSLNFRSLKINAASFLRTKVYVRFPKMLSYASMPLKWNDRKILYIKNSFLEIIADRCPKKLNVEKSVKKKEKTREARTKRYKESLVALSRCLGPGRTSEMPAEKKKDKQRKASSHLDASLPFTNMISRNRRSKRLFSASIKFQICVVSNGENVLEQIAG